MRSTSKGRRASKTKGARKSTAAAALERLALQTDIESCLLAFNADELRVVASIVSRLAIGRERYGALDLAKPRNWAREAAEEAADLVIYRAAAELAR